MNALRGRSDVVRSPLTEATHIRRRAIHASTQEHRCASYLADWAAKLEHAGDLTYPQAAPDHGFYGSLILHVTIRRDSTIKGIRVVSSSGEESLDQTALRIVELAAPCSRFPRRPLSKPTCWKSCAACTSCAARGLAGSHGA